MEGAKPLCGTLLKVKARDVRTYRSSERDENLSELRLNARGLYSREILCIQKDLMLNDDVGALWPIQRPNH